MHSNNNKALNRERIDISKYTYDLSDNRIAKYPSKKRDSSKLLVYKKNDISELEFTSISEIVPENSTLFYNNTRVIHARIQFFKKTGARIEIFCLSPHEPSDYQLAFQQSQTCTWNCMVGNLKKWKQEILETSFTINNEQHSLKAEKAGFDEKGNSLIKFSWSGKFSFAEILNATGKIPIPPYLNRDTETVDTKRYQTIYSQFDGSVAAPTAGLHFTPEVFKTMENKGIILQNVTLHVGAGTFQPVKTENAREHKMHGEQIIINRKLLENIIDCKGKIIATGTTTMRTLESIYWLGVKCSMGESPNHLMQWDWERLTSNLSLDESIRYLIDYIEKEGIEGFPAVTEIMIVPGYEFKVVDVLITNFHQPNSTLLLLIAAFIGEVWTDVYSYALENNFRFLSYGDSSILFRS